MAKSLKINGLEELSAFRKRVNRQHGRGGISETDKNYIMQRVNEIEARIVSMHERSPDLKEQEFGL